MGPIGLPEIVFLFAAVVFWALPTAAGIWALVTLHRIRTGQNELKARLSSIERELQSRNSG